MPEAPIAYLITFTCYGTWLHGDSRLSIDRRRNRPGQTRESVSSALFRFETDQMAQTPYVMDHTRRQLALAGILGSAERLELACYAVHVRAAHIHVVVSSGHPPETIMKHMKAWASRALNRAQLEPPKLTRWTRHGSTVWLWDTAELEAAVNYVRFDQGEPMAVYPDPAAP